MANTNTSINLGRRYSVIDANPLACFVRDLRESEAITDHEAALCLVQDDEEIGMEYAKLYAQDRVPL